MAGSTESELTKIMIVLPHPDHFKPFMPFSTHSTLMALSSNSLRKPMNELI